MTTPWQRVRQFFLHLAARMGEPEHALVARHLNPDERRLFYGMHVADQRHSVEVVRTLLARDPAAPERLLKLALLHDIGKQRVDFRLWERVAVVLWPRRGLALPDEPLQAGWRRAWQIKRWHAEYGARMLEALPESGPEMAALLRQSELDPAPSEELAAFHRADDLN